MAGLAAAERLGELGLAVTIFEKSRGFGGRMATRRVGDLQFDHGAQYFTAKGSAFSDRVRHWCETGTAAEWTPGRFVGAPRMSAPGRALSEGHLCITGVQVSRLQRGPQGWAVHDEAGMVAARENGFYDAVLLAVPAPQAIPLAASAGIDLPGLSQARYAPCIALMIAFAVETPCPGASQQLLDDEVIAWLAQDWTKPGRSAYARTFVAHASAAWSRKYLEKAPEDLRAALYPRFREVTGISAAPIYSVAHRWRYALVEQESGLPCLFNEEAMLGACGDWCLGPRVECAFDSGRALADTVAKIIR
jgi:renalase